MAMDVNEVRMSLVEVVKRHDPDGNLRRAQLSRIGAASRQEGGNRIGADHRRGQKEVRTSGIGGKQSLRGNHRRRYR